MQTISIRPAVPTILLTGWDWFWELIRRQYVYVSMNEFIGTRYGMPPVERFLSMMARFLSAGFGAPTWLWRSLPRQFGVQNLPPVVILCLLVPLMIHGVTLGFKGRSGSKRTFLFLWIVPYSIVVYLTSTPGYPRYFLPIIPPLVIALVSTAWSVAKSIKCSTGRPNVKGKLSAALVVALISLNFTHSAGLAATIHTTEVPMVRLARHVKDNYGRNTVVIVFHECEAFEDHPPRCRYLSAQYDLSARAGPGNVRWETEAPNENRTQSVKKLFGGEQQILPAALGHHTDFSLGRIFRRYSIAATAMTTIAAIATPTPV